MDAARAYAAHSAQNFCNAKYERPALLAMLGDVRGMSVLDAGCAAGEYAAYLLAHGAHVTAIDASAAMTDIVKERFGERVTAKQHDLREPLTWSSDGAFDVVLSSLTLHYLRDWSVPLAEFHRVLKPGGTLLVSTHHPLMTYSLFRDAIGSYFDTVLVRDSWDIGGTPHDVCFYHRPLQDVAGALLHAGFSIERIVEPCLTEPQPGMDAQWFERLRTQPWFLIIEASSATSQAGNAAR